jgi:hypothetical protein
LPQGKLFFFSLRDSKGFRDTENLRFGVEMYMDVRLAKTPALKPEAGCRGMKGESRTAQ